MMHEVQMTFLLFIYPSSLFSAAVFQSAAQGWVGVRYPGRCPGLPYFRAYSAGTWRRMQNRMKTTGKHEGGLGSIEGHSIAKGHYH